MERKESIRCRNIRRVMIAMFVVCGYLLSTHFATAYFYYEETDEWKFRQETAINLAFGSVKDTGPVYSNLFVGLIYFIIPLVGFFFMFFDHKSNVKNVVGLICGIIGSLAIALPIGANEYLRPGSGALISVFLYICITTLSGIAMFIHIAENNSRPTEETAPRLDPHV